MAVSENFRLGVDRYVHCMAKVEGEAISDTR